ncbi:GTPase IMAP member 7 [Mactra antiquata]
MEYLMASEENERRVILIGKTGNGKSSTGNSILGEKKFEEKQSTKSVTSGCEVHRSIDRNSRPRYVVCDTPGFWDADVNLIDGALEVQRSVKVCEKPHAFILVFSSTSRMTQDEKYTIDLLRIMFGEKVFDNCIVVFTRGSDFKDAADFERFWKESPVAEALVTKCSNRVINIENSKDTSNNKEGLDRLLTMIEEVSNGGRKTYNYLWLNSHTEVLANYRKYYDADVPIHTHLSAIANGLGRTLKSNIWKNGLFVTAAIVATGGVGYGAGIAGAAVVRSIPTIATALGTVAGSASIGVVLGVGKGIIQRMKFW